MEISQADLRVKDRDEFPVGRFFFLRQSVVYIFSPHLSPVLFNTIAMKFF